MTGSAIGRSRSRFVRERSPDRRSNRERADRAGLGLSARTIRGLVAALSLNLCCSLPATSRVLDQQDIERISSIRSNFVAIMSELSQTSRAQEASIADRECIDTIRQDLTHVGQELSGYENLMKIEGELTDVGDDGENVEFVRFALVRALEVLDSQRERLRQPPDHCARLPVSAGRTQSVLRIVESTIAALEGVLVRLPRPREKPSAATSPPRRP